MVVIVIFNLVLRTILSDFIERTKKPVAKGSVYSKKNFSKAKYFSTNRKYFDFWVVRYIETLQNNQNYLFIYRGLQNEYFFRL